MTASQLKTVLVTGASTGIGRATSIYLGEKGFTVIGTSRRLDRLEGTSADASDKGFSFEAYELDINDGHAVDRAMADLLERYGRIDVLVNNAGYGLWGPLGTITTNELRTQYETNVFAVHRLTRHVLPGMLANGRGKIINISSVLGRLSTPFNGAYASSKFALEGMSEALRTELWPLGIHVAVIEPGAIATDFQANQVTADEALDESAPYSPYIRNYERRHDRFNRFAGDPRKVAKVVHKIIRSRRPSFRYPVGPDARLGMLGARLLPERLFQALMSRAVMK